MSIPKQTCGNCKWAQWGDWTKHKPPRPQPDAAGYCLFADLINASIREQLPKKLPRAVSRVEAVVFWIFPHESNCPTWEGK